MDHGSNRKRQRMTRKAREVISLSGDLISLSNALINRSRSIRSETSTLSKKGIGQLESIHGFENRALKKKLDEAYAHVELLRDRNNELMLEKKEDKAKLDEAIRNLVLLAHFAKMPANFLDEDTPERFAFWVEQSRNHPVIEAALKLEEEEPVFTQAVLALISST